MRAAVAAVRSAPARALIAKVLRRDLGIEAARALSDEWRGPLPFDVLPLRARLDHRRSSEGLGLPRGGAWPRTSMSYVEAYREGRATAEDVARRAFAEARRLAAREPGMGAVHAFDEDRAMRAARDADARARRGEELGPLDGVPVVVKEEAAIRGLPHTLGTRWLPSTPAPDDAHAVARLREAGGVVLGHSPMTEYGMSPLGQNPHRAMPRNPHAVGHLPGGSSSGSAVAVATGLAPIALGTDGGGSIRVPACLCGVFGLKPTFGRVSTWGNGTGPGSSVVHVGPLAASATDLAIGIGTMAGRDPRDASTLAGPESDVVDAMNAVGRGVRGLRIGVDEEEWRDARPDIARAGRDALAALEREGASLVPVRLAHARHAAAIGYLTIGLEFFATSMDVRSAHMDEVVPDVALMLALFESFGADDYLDAQRLRAGLRRELAAVLRTVDVLALPMTKETAPKVSDREARDGFIDSGAIDAVSRYVYVGNLSGLPAATAPIGRDAAGLPFGLQIVGDAWDEACVLQVVAHLERVGAARAERPAVSVDLLG
jgi:aspartyl-tRNA(Asn)/glutamyl-tRNA(Gln) amidotransferase subunit A